jgi:DNA repair protein RadC
MLRSTCLLSLQEITRRLKETGNMLAIRVLDHVVLGDGRFYSFSDQGLL